MASRKEEDLRVTCEHREMLKLNLKLDSAGELGVATDEAGEADEMHMWRISLFLTA